MDPDFICKAAINDSIYPVEKGVYFGGNTGKDKIMYCSIFGYPIDTGIIAINGTWCANEDGIYYREVPGGDTQLKYIFIDHIKKKKKLICENKEIFWKPLKGASALFSGEHTNNDIFFLVDKNAASLFSSKNIMLRNMRHFYTHGNRVYYDGRDGITEYDIYTGKERTICRLMKDTSSGWTAYNGEVYQKVYDKGDYKLYYLGNRDYAPEEPILVIDYASRVYHFCGNSTGLFTTEGEYGDKTWNINFYPKPF